MQFTVIFDSKECQPLTYNLIFATCASWLNCMNPGLELSTECV